MSEEIIVVSGLPRSGTSLMMQLVGAGGIPTVTDNIRVADTDNPRGYFEYEPVKKIKADASWLPEIRGKAVKMVSQLLYDLPPTEKYQVIFMERDLDEVLASQEKMLERLGRQAVPREQMRHAFTLHLTKLWHWVAEQCHLNVLRVRFADVLASPTTEIVRINDFLGHRLNVENAGRAIDSGLYRNRKPATASV
jgi:hypothetical protein